MLSKLVTFLGFQLSQGCVAT